MDFDLLKTALDRLVSHEGIDPAKAKGLAKKVAGFIGEITAEELTIGKRVLEVIADHL